jgi:hypothetical protein
MIVLCVLVIIAYSCCSQSEKGISRSFDTQASHFSLQNPRVHAQPQNQLDEVQWASGDDISQVQHQERRNGFYHRVDLLWLLFRYLGCLLVGLAYLVTGVFHGSSSPTYGLLRIVTFLLHMDGKKERRTLLVIA